MQPLTPTKNPIGILGLVLYALGFVSAAYLAGTAVWADQETLSFNFGIQPDVTLNTLDCPVWLLRDEVGVVKLSYTNPSERTVDPLVRVSISEGRIDTMRVINDRQTIQPGETAHYSWEITAADAVYKRFVMLRVYTFRSGSLPSRGTTCGVFVLPLPGQNGRPLVTGVLVGSLCLIVAGFFLFRGQLPGQSVRENFLLQAMGMMGVLVILAMAAGLIGWWVVGGLLLIVSAFTLLTLLIYALMR